MIIIKHNIIIYNVNSKRKVKTAVVKPKQKNVKNNNII